MAFSTGSQAGFGYVTEVTYGTTPGTPQLQLLPFTSLTPEVTKEGYQSADIRSDRMIQDFRHGFKSTSLSLECEMKYGAYDDFLESALMGAWNANVLKAGTTRKSFSGEVQYNDIAQFHLYKGLMVNSFSMTVSTDAVVTGSFAMVGTDMVTAGTTADATPTAVTTNRSFDSFSGTIQEGGVTSAIITSIELSLENALEPAKVVGQDTANYYFDGRSNVTGTVNAYFENGTLLNKFLNETPSSLEFTLTDPSANTMTFLVPRIIYTGGSAPVGGEGGIVIALPFQAIYDQTENTNLKISR